MSGDAIARVPITDWLMGLVVLACGIVAIVAAWRYADQFTAGSGTIADDGPDEGRGPGEPDAPLALPPGPSDPVVVPNEIDEELWNIIDAEERRKPAPIPVEPPVRIAARATEQLLPADHHTHTDMRSKQ